MRQSLQVVREPERAPSLPPLSLCFPLLASPVKAVSVSARAAAAFLTLSYLSAALSLRLYSLVPLKPIPPSLSLPLSLSLALSLHRTLDQGCCI